MPHPTSPQHNPNSLDDSLGDVTSGTPTLSQVPKVTLDNGAKQAATQQLAALEELLAGSDPDVTALTVQIEVVERTVEHTSLPPGIKTAVPCSEYASPPFAREANAHGFTPYQWAGVQGIIRQARPDQEVDPTEFSPATDGRGLTVRGGLDLSYCTTLTALPEGLTVKGSLRLIRCAALVDLPRGLTVGGYLILSDCMMLEALPEGLTVEVDAGLNLKGCTALVTLPEDLTVVGSLDLRDCTAFAGLPRGFTVKQFLFLEGCTSLEKLPEGLTVGGDLLVRGCSSAIQDQGRALKAAGKIGGDLYTD